MHCITRFARSADPFCMRWRPRHVSRAARWPRQVFGMPCEARETGPARGARARPSAGSAAPWRASLGCCVRMSNTWHWPSRHVATSLFIAMSRRSNCRPHTPFAQVGGPAQPVGAQVEQLQVAVVVAGREAALGVAVRVAEGERPALARLRRAPPSGRGPCAACGKPVSLAQCEAVSSVKACKLYDTTRLVISTCRAV